MYKNDIKVSGITTGHVQGIATDKERKYMYYSFTTCLIKTDISAVNTLLYQNKNSSEYVKRISAMCSKIDWYALAKIYANILSGEILYEIQFPEAEVVSDVIYESRALIKDINSESRNDNRFKDQFILAAEGVAVMAEILAAHAGYINKRQTDTKQWLDKYRKKWLEDNKESELSEIERMFTLTDKTV